MKLITGNIFASKCQTLVNTVNCFGVMGTGLALEYRYRYPEMYARYQELCTQKKLEIGSLYLYKTNARWVLNFPTKNHWKYDSKPEYLIQGLQKFVTSYEQKGITSVAFPTLGALNGGLDIEESVGLMERCLSTLPIPVEIYRFDCSAHDDLFEGFRYRALNSNLLDLKKAMQLDLKKITKIKRLLEEGSYHSLTQFTKNKGIGETTARQCFRFAMNTSLCSYQTALL